MHGKGAKATRNGGNEKIGKKKRKQGKERGGFFLLQKASLKPFGHNRVSK